jgi:hypothetical protein
MRKYKWKEIKSLSKLIPLRIKTRRVSLLSISKTNYHTKYWTNSSTTRIKPKLSTSNPILYSILKGYLPENQSSVIKKPLRCSCSKKIKQIALAYSWIKTSMKEFSLRSLPNKFKRSSSWSTKSETLIKKWLKSAFGRIRKCKA